MTQEEVINKINKFNPDLEIKYDTLDIKSCIINDLKLWKENHILN